MATNNRRGALHTPLDTCRDKLLKFHDEAIKQSLEEREKAYNALHERLAQYEAHIADRIDREWQKKRLDENMARMRSEEARRKREVLERLEDNEKMKNKLRTENTRLRKADDVIIQYGMINSRRRQLTSKVTATHGDDSATCSDSNREVVLIRQNKSDPRDGLLSINFHDYQHIQVIRAPSANLGVAGARALSQALSTGACQNLQELHIAFNAIGDGGLAYLLGACTKNAKKLRHLDVAGNGITAEGIHGLKEAVAKETELLPVLKHFSLRRNPMQAQGAKDFAQMLLNGWLWPTLEVLDISSCEVGVSGLKALRSALRSDGLATRLAPRLQMVAARDNGMSLEVAREGLWPNVLQM